jgi:hypothetical protein
MDPGAERGRLQPESPSVIPNFREVGGFRNEDGRRVARNRLYRSAEFSWDTGSAAPTFLESVGVQRVIDLRAKSECPPSDGSSWSLERLHLPFLHSIEQRSFQPVDRSPGATAGRYYEYLLEGRSSVSRVLEALGDARAKPTILHCVAGRDRTGIAVACALAVLKVPDGAIARDYAESRVMDDEEGRNAHPDNILNLLRMVRERHGSVEALLADGGNGASYDRLAAALLEP